MSINQGSEDGPTDVLDRNPIGAEPIDVQLVTGDNSRHLETSFLINADVDQVWNAIAVASELANWFPFAARVDPGPGGHIWMSWDDVHEHQLSIEIWKPGEHLRTNWKQDHFPTPVLVDYYLEGAGGQTTLRLVHHGFSKDEKWDEILDGTRRGWSYELRCLRHYLENHARKTRRVARTLRSVPNSANTAMETLLSAKAMVASGTLPTTEGSSYTATTAEGDLFSGTVLYYVPGTDLAITVDEYDSALLRVAVNGCDGKEALHLSMSMWGSSPAQVQQVQARFERLLDRCF